MKTIYLVLLNLVFILSSCGQSAKDLKGTVAIKADFGMIIKRFWMKLLS